MTEFLFLLGVAVLVAANGFFVAAEFALVRARESRVEQMRDAGKKGAALTLVQIDRIDEYLSACQLGITMASLGIGFLGEPAIASLIEGALGDAEDEEKLGHRDRAPEASATSRIVVVAHRRTRPRVPRDSAPILTPMPGRGGPARSRSR
jgi:hypothetical protein